LALVKKLHGCDIQLFTGICSLEDMLNG